ncbi:MAG: class I SAM-dependent methyltransferase, partial [Muribaculaceae bacterium]|nr:class I SAM-dependent methyltransferase [Muribaculaceae bacterium]
MTGKNKDERLTGAELVNPYDAGRGKGEQVEQMFDSIAPAYDFMNTAMTLGLHRRWRDSALRAAARLSPSPSSI